MNLHYKQEVTVGGLVIVGVTLFVVGGMWLGGSSFKREVFHHARFTNVGKLQAGSFVKISGVQVGRVRKLDLVSPGNVLVSFSLSPTVVPKKDARASILESLAFSEATLVVEPGIAPDPLPVDGVIPGFQEPGLLSKVDPLLARADSAMQGVQAVVNKRTADDLHKTLAAMQRLLEVYSNTKAGPTAELTSTMHTLQRLSNRLDSTLAATPLSTTLRRADTLMQHLSTLSTQFTTTGAQLDTVLRHVNGGVGTLGKFATDTGFYGDARSVAKSLQEFLDDIKKHPGKITIQVKVF